MVVATIQRYSKHRRRNGEEIKEKGKKQIGIHGCKE